MHSPPLQNYLFRNRVGRISESPLEHSFQRINRQNYFLKNQVADLLQENNRLKSELQKEKHNQPFNHQDQDIGYSKEVELQRQAMIGKIWKSPRINQKDKINSASSKSNKNYSNANITRQNQPQMLMHTSSKQIRTRKQFPQPEGRERYVKKIQTEFMYEEREQHKEVKKNNYPYLSPEDKQNKKKQGREVTPVIGSKEITKKQKKHFLSLVGKTFESSDKKRVQQNQNNI